MSDHDITVTLNGRVMRRRVPARRTLVDFLRGDLGMTGTHAGCEHGVCGACTVIIDGIAQRSCLMFAVQADGAAVRTVEGLAEDDGTFSAVQQAMHDSHGLQCGYCTPGIVMSLTAMTEVQPTMSKDEMINAMSGHICRCTGYQGIMKAIAILAGEAPAKEPAHG